MKKLLYLPVKFMNRLTYIKKFTLIFFLFSIPIIILFANNATMVHKDYEFVKNQKIGLDYNNALRKLMKNVQQHRGLSALYIGGEANLYDEIQLKQEEIEKNIEIIDEFDKEYGKKLMLSEGWKVIREDWRILSKSILEEEFSTALEKQTVFIENILSLIQKVSYNSILMQSRIENYHIIQEITDKLPKLTETMGQARALGSGAASRGYLTEEESTKLLYLSEKIKEDLEYYNSKINVEFENYNLKLKLDKQNKEAKILIAHMLEMIDVKLLNSNNINIDSMEYFSISTKAIDKIYELLIQKSEAVSLLSQKDVDKLFLERNKLIFYTFSTFLVILIIFASFFKSIKDTIYSIEKAAKNIASGNFSERVKIDTQDETKEIEIHLNKMLDTMIENYKSLEESKKFLEKVANTDSLTGLPNRMFFIEKLDEAIENTARIDKLTVVMFLDLDNFKQINDILGHQMGDIVLKTVGSQLTGIVGERGVVSRLGGDEFTILLTEVDSIDKIKKIVKEIKQTICRPWILKGEEYFIGVSIGYTTYLGGGNSSSELMESADFAMYEEKKKRKIKNKNMLE